MPLCPITLMNCLTYCGGPDGARCPYAPPHRNPLAATNFPHPGAAYAGPALTQEAHILAIAQCASSGFYSQEGAGSCLNTLAGLADRILRAEPGPLQAAAAADQQQLDAMRQLEAEAIAHEQLMAAERLKAAEEWREIERQRWETSEITMGERIGWRIWRWRARGRGRGLYSYSQSAFWIPGEPMTGRPEPDNFAGVWAFKERECALGKGLYEWPRNFVWGAVAMWGEIIEHEDGWRAEHARIIAIEGFARRPPRGVSPAKQQQYYRHYRRDLAALRRLYGVGSFRNYQIWQRPQLAGRITDQAADNMGSTH